MDIPLSGFPKRETELTSVVQYGLYVATWDTLCSQDEGGSNEQEVEL